MCRGHNVETCIVVRHLTPSDEMVVKDGAKDLREDELYPLAKRPYGKLKVNEALYWHLGYLLA